MNNARQCKIESGKRTNFVLVVSIGNQVREKEHDTPCQRMEYKIKISVFDQFHH